MGKIDLGLAREEIFPSPEITDNISLAKLAKCKKGDSEWACDIFMHPNPMSDEAEDGKGIEDPISAPYFPYVLLVTETESGMVLGVQIVKELDDAQTLICCLIELAQKAGTPSRILVSNERAHTFFAKLAPILGAKLTKKKRIPSLSEARQGFAEQFGGQGEVGEDDIEGMMAMLSNPEAYNQMPDEALLMLIQAAESGTLPDGIVRLVQRERKKRGM